MTNADEIRSLAERVKDLRQELESVEARLRELSGGAPAPIEPLDSPTVLTTNHAQRRDRLERLTPWLAGLAAVTVLGAGIGVGYMLRDPLPAAAPTPVVVTPPAEAPVTATSAPPNPPATPTEGTTAQGPTPTSSPTSSPTPSPSPSPSPTNALPSVANAAPIPTPTFNAPRPAPTPRGPAGRERAVDHGF